jgi:hypothetical protein
MPQTDVVWLDIHGDPVPAGSVHAVSQVPTHAPTPDTCVRRLTTATFPGGVGVPETVPIELVQLSLVSVSPITVNCGGPTQWNVAITESGVQPQGSMELTPAVVTPLPNGTVTVPSLPVNFQMRFVPVGTGSPVQFNGNVNMQNPNPQAPGPPGQFTALFAGPIIPVFPGMGFVFAALLLALAGFWVYHRRAFRNA